MELSRCTPELRERLGLAPDRPYFEGFNPASLPSPAFVIDRAALQYNLDILSETARRAECDLVLALKAFSTFAVFDQVKASLAGSCASGPHEARLGRETIGKQVHAYSAAYTDEQFDELLRDADHIVFNNLGQWLRFREKGLAAKEAQHRSRALSERGQLSFGIRINPEQREGAVDLYDPSAPGSRLGTTRSEFDRTLREAGGDFSTGEWPAVLEGIEGFHFHNLCEQGAEPLVRTLEAIDARWGDLLARPEVKWLNMGGGHHITKPDYDRELLIQTVRATAERYRVRVILEPGEAIAIHTGILVATVLDIARNGATELAILDTSATCHMPDTLEMPYRAEVWHAGLPGTPEDRERPYTYRLGSQSCLAGDVMGDYSFPRPLRIGDRIVFDDMSHYTMVKTNTFNGIPLPALCTWESRTGRTCGSELVKRFGYDDFKERLS